MFNLTADHLEELCRLNHFELGAEPMRFMGLRGMTPVDPDDLEFRSEHSLVLAEIDYLHPRCSLLQWYPGERRFAIFAGSTVPHRKHVKSAMQRSGLGANQLMTGSYSDYRKGVHGIGKSTGHEAFRQTRAQPIRRSGDDYDYDTDDRVEFDNPFDNIHAGWSMGVDHDTYASAGCQVVVGYPRCERLGDQPDTGAWGVFKRNAYALEQNSFAYILLEGRTAMRIASRGSANLVRLRYGSTGGLVETVQQALAHGGFYEGNIDADFGERTLRAVMRFQESAFGPAAGDGIVGPMTAGALDVEWPASAD